MANCAELPDDLIAHIANHVKVIEDFIAFRAVCTSWQIAATKDNFDMFSTQVPLLMLGAKDDDFQEFYSLSKKKVSRIFLPEARGRECFPLGEWLFTMEDNTRELNLLHPFSRTQIQLPSLEDLMASKGLREKLFLSCVEKVALSANPSITSDYVLMINYHAGSNHLAFWRPGDLHWTYINKEIPDAAMSINYYKGHFYYVTCEGELWSFEVAGTNTPKPIVEPRLLYWPEDGIFGHCSVQFYIVELSDALLFVTRYADYTDDPEAGHKTFKFKVLELDVIKGELKEEVKTLGDSAIFVGLNSGACSVDSSKFTGIKPNHIYFTDDWFQKLYFMEDVGGKDTGVYNLENGKIESIFLNEEMRRKSQGSSSSDVLVTGAKGRRKNHGWADLPIKVLALIAIRVNVIEDFIAFRAVPLPSQKDLMASQGLEEEPIWTCIHKVVLSVNPSVTSDYVLVVNYHACSNGLAFWRPGDLHWTYIENDNFSPATGINYYKGRFYYVTLRGEIWGFEVPGASTPKPIVEPRLLYWSKGNMFRKPSETSYLIRYYLLRDMPIVQLVQRVDIRPLNSKSLN
ncbi:hypothetical protein CQW23_00215 [Capsicum baccatum]|uniref:F-box domain-containing protein n=1 Tax=Capsicum baccatum TaxID=33114 RepID=A0A2G2XK26_CAPBA|nr:hypothetical protein CQW23_00215 [Capsicum baccatum]